MCPWKQYVRTWDTLRFESDNAAWHLGEGKWRGSGCKDLMGTEIETPKTIELRPLYNARSRQDDVLLLENGNAETARTTCNSCELRYILP